MELKFSINLTEEDYIEYNKFVMFRSSYGKKRMLKIRIAVALVILVYSVIHLLLRGVSTVSFITLLPYLLVLIIYQLIYKPLVVWEIKMSVRSQKKRGKVGYATNSEMVFLEDCFIESTDHNKTEQKYSAIDRVSVVGDKVIYIQVNSLMSYVMPVSCFETKEKYDEFMTFIKTKCNNVEFYQ